MPAENITDTRRFHSIYVLKKMRNKICSNLENILLIQFFASNKRRAAQRVKSFV